MHINIISYQILNSRVFSGAAWATRATGEKYFFLLTVFKNVSGNFDHAVEIWINFLPGIIGIEASENKSRNVEQPLFLEGFEMKKNIIKCKFKNIYIPILAY
jgi:hypothetical protein